MRTSILAVIVATALFPPGVTTQTVAVPDTVIVQSGGLRLRGLLFRPDGPGPFPAVLFNHGLGHALGQGPTVIGSTFLRQGYALLYLYRRGHGLSMDQAPFMGDLLDREAAANGEDARGRLLVQLLERDQLPDVLAGLAYLRRQPFVDASKLVIAGHSMGGILTVLAIARDSNVSAAIEFAGAAGNWARSSELVAAMRKSVATTRVPIFLIHAANDFSITPGEELAADLQRLGKPHRLKIYPPFGSTPAQGHNFVHLSPATWEADVFDFLKTPRRFSTGAPPRNTALDVVHRSEHVEAPTREPMVAEHPNGALFVAGYGGVRPTLWKSVNRGVAWTRVDVGTEEQGAIGNSDADLAVAADGTLYFLSMLYDRTASEGRQISVGVSRDVGATWSWKTISKVRFDDRPWIDLAPDGTAHIIWNDGSGVSHVVSRDRGATWSRATRIHDKGGSSHLAVGPNGEVAVRITPASASGRQLDAGVELIAVSIDRGATWQKYPAPGQREWAPFGTPGAVPRWVEPIAWDSAGHLYSLWTDTAGVFVARSTDRAKSWSTWQVVRLPATFFPYMIARGRGQLAASWFSMSTPIGGDLRWHAALIDVSDGNAAPRVIQSAPNALDAWRRVPGGDALSPDAGGEYLGIIFLRDGGIGLATPIQNPATQRFGFTWWRLDAR